MVTGETITFNLTGGGPWGFRLQGGDNHPVRISKIRKKSKAHAGGIEEGDTVVSIKGTPVVGKSHQEAMDLVDSAEDTLTLQIIRGSSSHSLQERTQQLSHNAVLDEHPKTSDSTMVQSVTSSFTERDGKTTRDVFIEAHTETSDGKNSQSVIQQETISSIVTDYEPSTPVSSLTYHESANPFMPAAPESSAIIDSSTRTENTAESKENIAPTELNKSKSAPAFNVRNFKNEEVGSQPIKPMFDPKQFNEQEKIKKSPNMPSFRVKNVKHGALYKEKLPPPPVFAKPVKPSKLPLGENIPQFNIKNVGSKPGKLWQPQSANVTVTASTKSSERFLPSMENHPQQVYKSSSPNYGQNQNTNEHHHHEHLHVFGPPVQIHLENEGLDYQRQMSFDSGPDSPDTTSTGWSQRKLYADSAFYDDHVESYPTIGEQIKLCKIIATSLTSAINKRAKGARMFAKRRKKSEKWIHQGQSDFSSERSSSAGDVADLYDLESELSPTDGGTKPLFSFRIPTVALRVAAPDAPTGKMTLSRDEFENLRLAKKKCEHRGVSPNTCFSLVEDLQSTKGRGSRMFQKRLAKSEKWVVDESNAKTPPGLKQRTKLDDLLQTKSQFSPWAAAESNQYGMVDDAFRHLNEDDRMKKVKEFLECKYNKSMPTPTSTPVTKTDAFYIDPNINHKLDAQYELKILEGEDFNRTARGWGAQLRQQQVQDSISTNHVSSEPEKAAAPAPPPKPVVKRDYNPKVKGWGGPQPDSTHRQENGINLNTNSMSSQQHPGYHTEPYANVTPNNRFQAQSNAILPGCDL